MILACVALIVVGVTWVTTTAIPLSNGPPLFCTFTQRNRTKILKCVEQHFLELRRLLKKFLGPNYHKTFMKAVCGLFEKPPKVPPAMPWSEEQLQQLSQQAEPLVRQNSENLTQIYDDCVSVTIKNKNQ
ncbi:uncharacterized protein LOC144142160 [Haemaphysalis longicornis]